MDAAEPEHDVAAEWRDDLMSSLEIIEDQPLADRAASYAALHDELSRRLESGLADTA